MPLYLFLETVVIITPAAMFSRGCEKDAVSVCFTQDWLENDRASNLQTCTNAFVYDHGINSIESMHFEDIRAAECVYVANQLNDLFQRFFLNATMVMIVIKHEKDLWAMLFNVGPGQEIVKTHVEQLDQLTGFKNLYEVWAQKLGVKSEKIEQIINFVFIVGVSVQSTDNLNYITLDLDDSSASSFFVGAPRVNAEWIADLPWLHAVQKSRVIAFTNLSMVKSNGQLGVWRKKTTKCISQYPTPPGRTLVVIGNTKAWVYTNHMLDVTFTIDKCIPNPRETAQFITQELCGHL